VSADAPFALAWRRRLRRTLVLLAASLLAAAPVRAEEAMPAAAPGLPFAGVAIGDPLAKLEPHFHALDTGEPTCHRDSGVIGHLTCQYVGGRDAAGILWFGDVPYKVLAFDYFKERLVGFRLWTGVENYPALAARLAKLYGAPRSEDSSTIYDSRGRPLDQIISMWKKSAGVLELDKRSWSVDQSRLSLIAVSGQTEIITNGGSAEPVSPDSGTQGAGQGDNGNGAGTGAGGAGGTGLGGLGQLPGPGGLLSNPGADAPP
jgi:hypothetical protein